METLDLRKIPCPKNTAKALIYLATVDSGEQVEILLDDGEPISNVPPSLKIEGHLVLEIKQSPDGYWAVTVQVA